MPFLLFNSDALVIFAFFSKTVGMIVGQKLENVHSSDNFNQHPMLLQLVQNTEAVFAKNIWVDLHLINSMADLRNSMVDLRNSMAGLQNSMVDLRNSMDDLRNSMVDLQSRALRVDFVDLKFN